MLSSHVLQCTFVAVLSEENELDSWDILRCQMVDIAMSDDVKTMMYPRHTFTIYRIFVFVYSLT